MVKNRNKYIKNVNPKRNGVANGKVLKKSVGKSKTVIDARQKIIQKKRTTVVDARDILASMAKKQDARTKIQKLRGIAPKAQGNIKQIGKHILQKTDKNGKIMLVTNKNKAAQNMNSKVRQQLGLPGAGPTSMQPHAKKPMIATKRKDVGPLQIRRTIENDFTVTPVYCTSYEPRVHRMAHEIYAPPPPQYTGISPMIPMEMRHPMMETYTPSMRSNGNFMEVDSDEEPRQPRARTSRVAGRGTSSGVHSRLDSAPTTHGILAAQPKTKVVLPVGHRIVVSNLQSTVTQDDIRELFEDIGQLIVARLVRPGTGEVIYKNLKDAQKAVDTYHNRQLDGQPMKCLLVNKRPVNNPTGPAVKANDVVRKQQNTVDKLVPDLSTIHKVLFQRH